MDDAPTCSFFLTRPKAWIEVSGEDAPHFLQSQFSGDLRVEVGSAVPGLWLDHRARLHGEGVVLKRGEASYLIASLSTPAAGLLERLENHVIADDVDFEDRTDQVWCVLMPRPAVPEGVETAPAGRFLYQESSCTFDDVLGVGDVSVFVGPENYCREITDTLRSRGASRWTPAQWDAWAYAPSPPVCSRGSGAGRNTRRCRSRAAVFLVERVLSGTGSGQSAGAPRTLGAIALFGSSQSSASDETRRTPLPGETLREPWSAVCAPGLPRTMV